MAARLPYSAPAWLLAWWRHAAPEGLAAASRGRPRQRRADRRRAVLRTPLGRARAVGLRACGHRHHLQDRAAGPGRPRDRRRPGGGGGARRRRPLPVARPPRGRAQRFPVARAPAIALARRPRPWVHRRPSTPRADRQPWALPTWTLGSRRAAPTSASRCGACAASSTRRARPSGSAMTPDDVRPRPGGVHPAARRPLGLARRVDVADARRRRDAARRRPRAGRRRPLPPDVDRAGRQDDQLAAAHRGGWRGLVLERRLRRRLRQPQAVARRAGRRGRRRARARATSASTSGQATRTTSTGSPTARTCSTG